MNKLQPNKKIFLEVKELKEIGLSYPTIIKKKSTLDVFYGSTVKWENNNRDMVHIIKFLKYNLNSKKIFCKKIAINKVKNICEVMARPIILDYKNILHLWFSYRNGRKNDKYKIGYAFFKNKKWKLILNKNIIKKSKVGFDSEMVEYPYVFKHKKKLFMLYNGNSYLSSGIGLSVEQNGKPESFDSPFTLMELRYTNLVIPLWRAAFASRRVTNSLATWYFSSESSLVTCARPAR
jgi:hypothetical protein